MSLIILARHPYEERRALILDPKQFVIEWRNVPSNVEEDHEYSDDLTNILRGPNEIVPEIYKLLSNKAKYFPLLRVIQIPPRSRIEIDIENKVRINNHSVGTLSRNFSRIELNRLESVGQNGGILLLDNSVEELLLRIFLNSEESLSADSSNRGAGVRSSIRDTNKETKNTKKVNEPGEGYIDNYIVNLLERPLEPLKVSVDKIDRRMQELSMIRETVQRIETRVRNLSLNPVNPTRKPEEPNKEAVSLLEALDLTKQRVASLELALSDANHRLETAELRINDKLKKIFQESIVQSGTYINPQFIAINKDNREKLSLQIQEIKDNPTSSNEKELIDKYELLIHTLQEQNDHLSYTMELILHAFNDAGWLPKR
jgi:hypothetical protein